MDAYFVSLLLGLIEGFGLIISPCIFVFFTQTPETYLGYARADTHYSPELIKDKTTRYQFSPQLSLNAWSLEGLWQAHEEYVCAEEAKAALKINFKAHNVYAVMGNSTASPISIKVILSDVTGKKIKESMFVIDKYSIYQLVTQKQLTGGYLQIIVNERGLQFYTLTFS